ncbi:MAG: AraC family transcriptional regulator [Pseudomonadales bacterium]|nr:AraC family transcriptional regulator [Pseudomonadales bacterium]MBP7909499.1 AraC family transcriptional regulator [Pseudomonadales bacterium]
MTAGKLKISNRLAFYLVRMAARGFSSEQVLAGTGLNAAQIRDETFRAQPNDFRRIVRNIIRLTNDPCIGIALGSEFKVSDLGILGYAALTASTLDQSRELFRKYIALTERVISTTNEVCDGRWFSEIREMFPLGELLPFVVEEFVSQTISLASSISNRPFQILELRVTYARPSDITPYNRRFNCPILFDQPRNLLFFDIQTLNVPVSLANAEVFRLCEQQCQLHAGQRADDDDLVNRIRKALLEKPGEFPTLEQMATRLRMGSRTLRRRLGNKEVTYQEILDDVRRDLALQYLEFTTLKPKEIGFLLGYNSVGNFRRAFKNWTGGKLSDFRQDK